MKNNPFNRDNYIELPENVRDNRSFVKNGDEGQWRGYGRSGQSLQQDNPAVHEFGHLMGLGDRYKDAAEKNK